MGRHSITRRELLGLGVGAAAGIIAAPRALSALGLGALEAAPRPLPPMSDMDVALAAARWIRRSRIETKAGVTWPADPLKPTSVGTDLYNGMPGVILFHLELFHATGDATWLDDARLGANELTAQLPAMAAANQMGLYTGMAGAVFVLEETHRATGDARYRDAARQALTFIHTQAVRTARGATWAGPSATNDIISGSAGIGLLLVWADQRMGDPASRTLALSVGHGLIDIGIQDHGGLKWRVAPDVTDLYPNFSHGTAGVAYFLSTLLRATGELPLMGATLSGARYLQAVANTEGGGFKVFHHEPGGEDLYYLSWCHGPAGTARCFHRLAQITQHTRWDDVVQACARAIIQSGMPERQSPGYWNNVGQCCGNAGVGEFFITLARRSSTPDHVAMIRRVAANTQQRATVDGDGLKWIQAENRASPADVVAQTGYMQGAAGVGAFFLHADGLTKGRAPLIEWPDAPAFDPCVGAQRSPNDMSTIPGAHTSGCNG